MAGKRTSEYRVEHPRWKIWRANEASFKADVSTLYGGQFVEPLSATPASQFIAEGSDVQVWRRVDDPVLIDAMATKTHMRLLRVILVALLTAVVGCVLGIVIGDYVTQLLHVSNFEGGRGYMVFFVCAPLGILAGLITGLMVGICSKRPGFVGFLRAQGLALLILGVVAGIFTGVFYIGSDKPPKIDGRKLALDFELRVPASAQIPQQPNGYAVRVSFYENDRQNRYAFIDWKSIVRGSDQITIPGNVEMMTHSASRSLLASVGDQPIPQLFDVKLPPVPRKQDEVWSDWMKATQRADLTALPEPERFSIRYRVRELD